MTTATRSSLLLAIPLHFLASLPAAAAAAASSNRTSSAAAAASSPCIGGRFRVAWDPSAFRLTVGECEGDRVLWSSAGDGPFLRAGAGNFEQFEVGMGSFRTSHDWILKTVSQTVDRANASNSSFRIEGRLEFCRLARRWRSSVPYSLAFSWSEDMPAHLGFRVELDEAEESEAVEQLGAEEAGGGGGEREDAQGRVSHVYLRYAAAPDEAFFGFGEQYSTWNMRGKKVDIITQEQGVGRGIEPMTILADFTIKASGGSWSTTYSAIPHYVTSKLNSLYLKTHLYSAFDLRGDDSVEVSVARNPSSSSSSSSAALPGFAFEGAVVAGSSFKELVSHYTGYSGRMPRLPKWAACGGAVLGLEGGTANVTKVYREMVAAGTPVAALWLQDWSGFVKDSFGTRVLWNWELDRTLYAGWDAMLEELRTTDTRVMTYVNPYLFARMNSTDKRRNYFKEAAERGFLVRNSSGLPYLQHCGAETFTFGTIDLYNPEAADWYASEILEKNMIVGSNTSGWMADFGEYLPFDAVIGGEESGPVDPQYVHNKFPEDWAELNHRAVKAQQRDGDIVYFHRSASTRSPQYAALFWAGDQLVTWDAHDGLHSALIAILTGGLSGMSMMHSDVGGYTMFDKCVEILGQKLCLGYYRGCELLMRWTEMSAFTDAMFRTHIGSRPGPKEAQVWSSNTSKAHFSAFAKVHQALCQYREHLVEEAHQTGLPMARHPLLEFPDDEELIEMTTQVMLGPEIMVAPVLTKEAEAVEVYLPEIPDDAGAGVIGETWVRWPGMEAVSGMWEGGRVKADAPLGVPAVFLRSGFEDRFPDSFQALKELGSSLLDEATKGTFQCPV